MKPQEGKDLMGAIDKKRMTVPEIKLDATGNNKRKVV